KDEFAAEFLRFGRLWEYGWVKGVVRIWCERGDVKFFAERTLVHARGDAAREMREQVAVRAEDLEPAVVQKNAKERGLFVRNRILGVDDLEARAGADVVPVNLRVEPANQLRVRVTFLGDQFK